MKKHHLLPLLLALLTLQPIGLQAAENTATADNYWDGSRLYLRLGSFFVNNANSTIRFDSKTAAGVTLDSAQDLGMNSSANIARIEGLFRFNKTHSLGVQWYDLQRSGTANISDEFTWDGEVYPVGANVDSYLNTAVFKLGYNYSFYHNEKVELAVGAGLHVMRIEVGVAGELTAGDTSSIAANGVTVTAPLPVFGAKIGYYVTPSVRWIAVMDLFLISALDYDGQFIDTGVDIEWLFSKHVGIGGGVNVNTLGLRGSPETDNRFRLTNNISGVQAYLFMHF